VASTEKRDPREEAALDEHLRGIAHRNGRGATAWLGLFSLALWPTDLVIFGHMPDVLHTVTWMRTAVICTVLLTYVLLRSSLGPRFPTLILVGCGTIVMFAIGVGFGKMGGPSQPWITLTFPALFFSVLAPVRLRHRIYTVVALVTALLAGFLIPYPSYWHDPMVRVDVSFVISEGFIVTAVGHLSYRILRQSFFQSLEVQRTQDLRRLTEHLQSAREDERSRISRELHDELGQELTALNLALTLTQQRFQRDPQSIAANLVELQALLSRTQATTRGLVSELRPRMIDELGLQAALEWLIRQTEDRSGVSCQLVTDDLASLPISVSNVAFRIVQEALTNVARHSQAKTAKVSLMVRNHNVELAVVDDGVGMERSTQPRGFGLIGIRERVAMLAGRLDIDSRPGVGTTLRASLPLTGGMEGRT
jgi:signal transduction histidine kinase